MKIKNLGQISSLGSWVLTPKILSVSHLSMYQPTQIIKFFIQIANYTLAHPWHKIHLIHKQQHKIQNINNSRNICIYIWQYRTWSTAYTFLLYNKYNMSQFLLTIKQMSDYILDITAEVFNIKWIICVSLIKREYDTGCGTSSFICY